MAQRRSSSRRDRSDPGRAGGAADRGRSGARSRTGSGRRAALRFEPLTRATWKDLTRLFGERGACGGCWCMFWRRLRSEWEANRGAGNRRALKRLVDRGEPLGVLAYRGDEPVGWCAVAPRERYSYLSRSRLLAPVDGSPDDGEEGGGESGVWSVTCFFVERSERRRGLTTRLLRAAVDLAREGGARAVEGYPIEPYADAVPAVFAWNGLPSAFERAGFREVERRSPSRPIYRRAVRSRRPRRHGVRGRSRGSAP